MKAGIRYAVLSSAVAATLGSLSPTYARDLRWDPNSTGAATGSDGSGNWDLSTPIWVDNAAPGSQTIFANGDSATFGTTPAATGTATANTILLNANVTVADLTLSTAASGAGYNLFDQGDGNQTLTIAGSIIKGGLRGTPQILLTNAAILTAGDHTIAAGDSPGDGAPELTFNSGLTGTGSITINNALGFAGSPVDIQYGTTAFNVSSDYSGGTNIINGRLVANASNAMGTGTVSISAAGALAFAGAGTNSGNMTFNNAFNISRSDYSTANTNNRYQDAIVANNDGTSNTITLNGPITVNSTDARITANTNRIVITQPLVAGATSGANSVLDLSGDFAGFIDLQGDNTAYGTAGGAIQLRNGVEVSASSEANLGGATSKLILSGGTIRPLGTLGASGSAFMTNFGAHNLGTTPINTGLDLDSSQTFISNGISGTAIGTRGNGTITFTGANVFTGRPFFDGGTVNINDNITFGGFATRSPTVNIAPNVTLIKATSTANEAIVIAANGPDTSTLNIASNLTVADSGGLAIGDATGTNGTVNNAGTLTVGNEMWVGNGGGTGTYNQTGGSLNVGNWFAIGRDVNGATGAHGTVDLSGGTITKSGGGNSYLGEAANSVGTMTMRNNSSFTINVGGGEFWIGQGGGTGNLTIQDTASLTVNSWLALGRANSASVGTLTMNGGSLTKPNTSSSGTYLAVGSGGSGTFIQNAGTVNVFGTRIAENSSGTMTLNGGVANFTGEFSVGYQANSIGTLNINGTANVTVPGAVLGVNSTTAANGGIINLNGGTLTGASFTAGAATNRLSQFNFNGGTLRPSATNNTNFVGAKVQSNVLANGAKIDTNGFDATIPSALIHSTTAALDGGLTKSGLGTLTLTGANTYTGTNTVTNGTLKATSAAYATVLNASNGGLDMQKGKFIFDYTGTTSPVGQVKTILDAGYPGGFATGQIRSTTHPANATLGYGDNGTNNVTVMVTLGGDANLDGTVDFNDFLVLQNNFNNPNTRFDQGNFNYDGATDFNDFLVLQNNFGQSVTGSPVAVTSAQVAALTAFANSDARLVPEPASLAVLAGMGGLLMGRRRRTVA